MVDVINRNTYQVQWSIDRDKRFLSILVNYNSQNNYLNYYKYFVIHLGYVP